MRIDRDLDIQQSDNLSVLDETLRTPMTQVRRTPFSGPIVWSRDTLSPDDGLVKISQDSLDELQAFVALLRRNPLPTVLLDHRDFELDTCRAMMAEARQILDEGTGFVIIDRLPIDEYSVEEAKAVYWILGQMVSRPVAQSWDAKMIYDVRDLGRQYTTSVRGDTTNKGENFHTDNNYNLCPPHYVALFCLNPAMEGGINSIVSFYTVYNEMLKRHPFELIERLYQPYLFNRQKEHAPGDPMILRHPLFEYDGTRLNCKLSHIQVASGQKLAGLPLDELGQQALETLESIMEEPQWNRKFFFERGQIQIVDNRRCGHRRTGFIDFPEPERKRHLVRLWLRNEGRRFYHG
jgi:alpha-ketoglutarate-dependent taurine dioxygenase